MEDTRENRTPVRAIGEAGETSGVSEKKRLDNRRFFRKFKSDKRAVNIQEQEKGAGRSSEGDKKAAGGDEKRCRAIKQSQEIQNRGKGTG